MSPPSHPRPRKTSSLLAFSIVSVVVFGIGRVSDSSSPLSSAGAGAGVGVVVATGRSDKYAKLERSRTKIPYDSAVLKTTILERSRHRNKILYLEYVCRP